MTPLLAFDLMGTLITDPFERAHEAATGRPMSALRAAGLMSCYHRLETSEITVRQYWETLRNRGFVVDEKAFHDVRRSGYRWLPGMANLCAEYARRHRLVIASNCPAWVDSIQEEFFVDLPVDWFPSYRFGVRKPDVEFFSALCARFDRGPADLLLVDDKERNTEAARRFGGRAITFRSAWHTRARLESFLRRYDPAR